jgi:hypothetical protein
MADEEGAMSIVSLMAALVLVVAGPAAMMMGTASQLVVIDGGWSSYVVSYRPCKKLSRLHTLCIQSFVT